MCQHEFTSLIWFQFNTMGFLTTDPEAKKSASNYLVYLFTFLIMGSTWINLKITNLYLSRVGKLTNLGMMFVKFLFGVRVDWQKTDASVFLRILCVVLIFVFYKWVDLLCKSDFAYDLLCHTGKFYFCLVRSMFL